MKKTATLTLFTLAIAFAPLKQADAQSASCKGCLTNFVACVENCPPQDIPWGTCVKGCGTNLDDCIKLRCKGVETPEETPKTLQ